jgi:hypothetical protein
MNKSLVKPNKGNLPVKSSFEAKRAKITKTLNDAGLTDKKLAEGIKTNVEAGMGVKATADTALRGIELGYRLKGYLDTKPEPQNLSQTNIYIEELKTLSDDELKERLIKVQNEIAELEQKVK